MPRREVAKKGLSLAGIASAGVLGLSGSASAAPFRNVEVDAVGSDVEVRINTSEGDNVSDTVPQGSFEEYAVEGFPSFIRLDGDGDLDVTDASDSSVGGELELLGASSNSGDVTFSVEVEQGFIDETGDTVTESISPGEIQSYEASGEIVRFSVLGDEQVSVSYDI